MDNLFVPPTLKVSHVYSIDLRYKPIDPEGIAQPRTQKASSHSFLQWQKIN